MKLPTSLTACAAVITAPRILQTTLVCAGARGSAASAKLRPAQPTVANAAHPHPHHPPLPAASASAANSTSSPSCFLMTPSFSSPTSSSLTRHPLLLTASSSRDPSSRP
ncbi:hypothetical protein PWT90_10809 [Aphanocladium album]|nr:hypothetical protein PWT90_10809 [Aphanocladium album]